MAKLVTNVTRSSKNHKKVTEMSKKKVGYFHMFTRSNCGIGHLDVHLFLLNSKKCLKVTIGTNVAKSSTE